jgi:hypothetical protein
MFVLPFGRKFYRDNFILQEIVNKYGRDCGDSSEAGPAQ